MKIPDLSEPENPRQTSAYRSYMASDAWRQKKVDIINKRGRICEHCGTAGHVELHHKTYDRLGNEADEDLELLCKNCHAMADAKREASTRYENARHTYMRKKYGEGYRLNKHMIEEFDKWFEKKGG